VTKHAFKYLLIISRQLWSHFSQNIEDANISQVTCNCPFEY